MLACAASTSAQTLGNDKWAPYLDVDGKLGSKRNTGEGNLFIPVNQDPRTLYFLNLRGRMAGDGDYEGSLGGGVRRMLDNGWNLGTYAFLDHRRTETGSLWNQGTLGVEALGSDMEWRANIYRPLGSRSRRLDAQINSIDWVSAGIAITSTAREEHALPGVDLEAGWRLPIYDSEQARQLRVYLAGYRFADEGIQVQGGRVRAEYVLAQFSDAWQGAQLSLNVQYQRDNARGGQTFAGLRLRIPLGTNGASSRHLSAQERRMVAPIVRDVDIVSQTRSGAKVQELAVTTADGQAFAARSSQFSTGADVQAAVTAAGTNSVVLLNGTFATTTGVQLQAGQSLVGAGTLVVRTASGQAISVSSGGATVNATMTGGTTGAIIAADNSTIKGMTLNVSNLGTTGSMGGVYANNVSNVMISNNTITSTTGSAPGANGINIISSSNVTVANNDIKVTSSSIGSGITAGQASVVIQGNTLDVFGTSGSRSLSLISASIRAGSTGNTLIAGTCSASGTSSGIKVSFTNAADCGR